MNADPAHVEGSASRTTSAATDASRVAPADPMQDIASLREQNRIWRLRFYGSCVAFAFLFAVSIVQFTSTFMTARLLHETRQEIEKLRNDQSLYDLRKAREAADLVVRKAKETEMFAEQTRELTKDVHERAKVIDELLTGDIELRAKIIEQLRRSKAEPQIADRIERLLQPKDAHGSEPKKPIVCPDPPQKDK